MTNIIFSISTVGPVFIIIALGVLFRRVGLVDAFIAEKISRLIFHVFLPALILRALMPVDFSQILFPRMVLVVFGTLIVGFLLALGLARLAGMRGVSAGLFASGATWSNVAIIGYALGEAVYGEEGLIRATIFSALVLPSHSIIGVIAMDNSAGAGRWKSILIRLIKNPIILAILLGAAVAALPVKVPELVTDVFDVLGRAALPLALVAIGSSLRFARNTAGWVEPLSAAVIKLAVLPLLGYGIARLFHLDPQWTSAVVLGFACPTAVSFYVVSRGLGHSDARSAAIVTATTVGSAISTGAIVALLGRLETF